MKPARRGFFSMLSGTAAAAAAVSSGSPSKPDPLRFEPGTVSVVTYPGRLPESSRKSIVDQLQNDAGCQFMLLDSGFDIRELGSSSVSLSLRRGSTYLITYAGPLSRKQIDYVKDYVQPFQQIVGCKFIVLSEGLDIKVFGQ